jgi:hypothetical protein
MAAEYDLDQQVVAALALATGKPVGYGVIPLNHGTNYLIVTPTGGPPATGDLGSQITNKDFRYDVTAVGADLREVRWIKSKAYTRMMTGTKMNASVQWVTHEMDGAIVSDGDVLFSSVDSYLVRI